jgi:hypothetical protein
MLVPGGVKPKLIFLLLIPNMHWHYFSLKLTNIFVQLKLMFQLPEIKMNFRMNKISNGYILVLILLFSCKISYAGKITCAEARKGIFKSRNRDGSLVTVIRSEDSQTETLGSGKIIKSEIKWTSDCSFILFNRRLLRGSDSLKTDLIYDTLYNEISEINNFWTTINSKYRDSTFKSDYFIVDTSQLYDDLTELDQFEEYKGGVSTGTFSGYNYVITSLQHPIDKSKYIFAFEEALTIGNKIKYKLLDHIYFTLDSSLRITTRNCRFNDIYDNEIAALYYPNKKNGEALIIKSWRFSKTSLKIIEEPIQKVKYKEADKYMKVPE